MFFVVLLSLAALASAGPVIQQQETEDVNHIPFYKHLYYPYSMIYRKNRYYPHYGQIQENYPFLPYNYKNVMTYPYRYTPEIGEAQPKVDYDAQDIYHLHDVKHHHVIKNVHDFEHQQIIQKYDDTDYPYYPYAPIYDKKDMSTYKLNNGEYYPYLPYSPAYYNKDMNTHKLYNKEYYPYLPYSPVYDKDMNTYKLYNKEYYPYYPYSPMYYSKDIYNREYPHVNKYYGKSFEHEYVQPYSNKHYNRYWDMDYVRNYFNRNLYSRAIDKQYVGVQYVKPVIYKSLEEDYIQPAMTKNLDIEYVHPAIPKTLNVEYTKPVISSNVDVDYVHPVTTENVGLHYVKPVVSRGMDVDYAKPVDSAYVSPYYYNLALHQGSVDGRFTRNTDAHVEQKHDIPVAEPRHEAAVNFDVSHQIPVEHQEVAVHQQAAQGVQRQDLQITADLGHVHSEQHDSQAPIHRQTRETNTNAQSVVATPQYVYYPYYLNPYATIPTPLLVRNALYPNYYSLFFRK